jgi:serine/threonine protein kinase
MSTELWTAPVPEDPTEETVRNLAPGSPLLPGLLAWDLLGGGNHCESWLAWSVDLWSPVVVKLPRPAEVRDAEVWQDLLVESRAHASVSHPGFQRLWSAELAAPVPHLVLEYVEGPSLATLADDARLTVPDVLLLGLQLAGSLRHLHRRDLVHLDVKPANVVVREGRAVLLDLGILTPAGRTYVAGDAPGTPSYMPPELVRDGEVHAAADVFALGRTLEHLLEHAPALPRVRALLGAMTDPDPRGRPDDDTVLRSLHGELGRTGSGLWPAWATAALG